MTAGRPEPPLADLRRFSNGAGDGPPEHVDDERDVLVVVLGGAAEVDVGDHTDTLRSGEALIIPRRESADQRGPPRRALPLPAPPPATAADLAHSVEHYVFRPGT